MQDKDPRIEKLHEQASAHYLQGDFSQALAAWRELLTVDPADERATEGARLCEMLDTGAAQPPADALAEPSAPSFDIPDPIEADRPAVAEPSTSPVGGQIPPPIPETQDAGAIEQVEPVSPEGVPPPVPTGDPADQSFDFDFTEIESVSVDSAPAALVDDPSTSGGAAAQELASRTAELITEATAAYEQGRRDDALSLIQRVFILDESNETASSLQDIIHAEIEAEREDVPPIAETPPPVPSADAPAPPPVEAAPTRNHEPLDLDLDGAETEAASIGIPVEETAPREEPIPEPQEAEELVESFEDEALPELGGDPFGDAEPLPLPERKKGIAKWAAIAAALIVVLAGGAYLAMGYFGGDDPVETASTVEPLPTPEPTPELPPEIMGEPDAASENEIDREKFALLMERGRSAVEREDYAAAVLAFGEAIKLDPSNLEAKRQFEATGDLYRDEREQQQKWEAAIASFNDGDYRSALQAFYRVPKNEETERLTRYKRNAWYNMAVRSLKSGDCKNARSHMREVRALDPDDAALSAATDLVDQCGDQSGRTYYAALESLELRGLED